MALKYVQTDGSNLNVGDDWGAAHAWQNLWYAFDAANPNIMTPGDILHVGGDASGHGTGQWNETQKCSVNMNGDKDNPITIKAVGGAVKINGATIIGGDPIIKFENGFGRFTRLTVNDAETDSWELYGCAAHPAIYIYDVHGANPCGTLIHRVKAYNNLYGILWNRQYGMIIAGCEVYNNASYGIHGTNKSQNAYIMLIGNKTYNNGAANIRMLSTHGLIVGNLIYGASEDGILITYGQYGKYAFNTICDNDGHGITLWDQWISALGGSIFINNIIAGNGAGGAGMGFYRNPLGVTGYCGFSDHNCWYDNMDGHASADFAMGSMELVDVDPLFIGGGDYSLQADSPCIGAGHTAWGNFDIGAIQRIMGGSGGFSPLGATGSKYRLGG